MNKIIVSKPGAYSGEGVHITGYQGDAFDYIKEQLTKDPYTEVEIHGGDGSVYEAVNAIMSANACEQCSLTVVPSGTGNDFVKSFNDDDFHKIDLIKVSDKYCANMVNIGFDCDVVIATEKIKGKKIIGSFSYILGVVATVFKKFGKHFEIELTYPDGACEKRKGDYLLLFVANGQYCGGGFRTAPIAKLDDGLMDVMLFNKVSRFTLARLIGKYKSGIHLDEKGELIPSFKKYAIYAKCKSIKVSGPKNICIDGEVLPLETTNMTIIHSCLNVRVQK